MTRDFPLRETSSIAMKHQSAVQSLEERFNFWQNRL